MKLIDIIITTPIGSIMAFCYNLIGNYGWTIIIFTLIIKLITLPIGVLIQKNSIKMVKMQPMIDELKRKYPDKADKEQFMEEQIELFKKEKYNAGIGCLPMLIQIPIIIGIIYVIYNPLKYLLGVNATTINALNSVAMKILGVNELGHSGTLTVVELIQNQKYTHFFSAVTSENIINLIRQFDTSFMGLNLSLTPTFESSLMIIPILSALSALLLCLVQNRENVLQQEQGALSKWGMTIFLVLFSLYFTFIVPAGVGLYWICSNVLSTIQIYILNWIYNPKKYIDYEYLQASKEANRVLKQINKQKQQEIKKNEPRERQDYKRFLNSEGKRLVFYSEKSGFYKYFENVIDEIINRSNIVIHYITSDPYDAIFNKNNPRILPYYVGEKKLIPLFMKMDADIVVMTMPDLDNFHIKRSMVRKDIEYIYMFHAPLSFIMTIRDKALDNYDTIFCTGIHQAHEIRESEKLYNLKPKMLVECGYGVIENMRIHYANNKEGYSNKKVKRILIAPSWQEDNILDSCLDEILDNLLDKGFHIIIRPHPEYVKRFPMRWNQIMDKYGRKTGELFTLETDFSSNETVYSSDVLITDWSGIAYEYSLATLKPSLFINTKMKIANPNWEQIPLSPLSLTLRNVIGIQLEKSEVSNQIFTSIQTLLRNKTEYQKQIKEIEEKYIFNFGRSGMIGASYIIARLKN
ncbi:membrane protein insertase YidC [Clostridium aminobutyricum]|uniref:Membrane protein insertase YidC n=1 Tax=Clostridium aminobutyricum TaxID=33953 RepID=A0A939IJF9_CLOAM|nr:membrane protein insertase YidC [Clostridium aminobutyricum]MBN7774041.1 membrane protein insertase YidC [Clostridium aminobutyricum]